MKSSPSPPSHAAYWIATWFGCGLFPVAPGTVGSLAAIAIGFVLAQAYWWRPLYFVLLSAAALPVAIWAADRTALLVNQKDPQLVVVDEVLGQWIALAGAGRANWKSWTAAFFLFRLFDVWKPAPVHQLEHLPGGTGIVADDLMAGLYAAVLLALVLFLTGWFNFN
jgi:phosphatidylglycerophosphatase A